MKRIWIILGVVVLVGVLAGAAYVGGQLLSAQNQPQASSGGPIMKISTNGGANQQFKLDIEPAKEIANLGAPLFKGVFVRQADNSIFVGTGAVKMLATKDQGGNVSASTSYDGPVVETVVTHDTTIYRDVTMKQFNGQPPAGQKVQQVLEPGTIDEIGANSMVQVWGTQNGDRAVANVLVYSLPAFIKKP